MRVSSYVVDSAGVSSRQGATAPSALLQSASTCPQPAVNHRLVLPSSLCLARVRRPCIGSSNHIGYEGNEESFSGRLGA